MIEIKTIKGGQKDARANIKVKKKSCVFLGSKYEPRKESVKMRAPKFYIPHIHQAYFDISVLSF